MCQLLTYIVLCTLYVGLFRQQFIRRKFKCLRWKHKFHNIFTQSKGCGEYIVFPPAVYLYKQILALTPQLLIEISVQKFNTFPFIQVTGFIGDQSVMQCSSLASNSQQTTYIIFLNCGEIYAVRKICKFIKCSQRHKCRNGGGRGSTAPSQLGRSPFHFGKSFRKEQQGIRANLLTVEYVNKYHCKQHAIQNDTGMRSNESK